MPVLKSQDVNSQLPTPTIVFSAVVGDKVAAHKARLKARGFTETPIPVEAYPCYPNSITHLSSEELGNLYGLYNAWKELADSDCAEALAQKLYYTEMYNKMYAVLVANMIGTKDAKNNAAIADEGLNEISDLLTDSGVYYELISGKQQTISSHIVALSREFTRRGTYK